MKNNHEIILKQYAAYCKEQPLYLGTAGSYGMEMLTIIREGVWAEYDILAAFHPPVGACGRLTSHHWRFLRSCLRA